MSKNESTEAPKTAPNPSEEEQEILLQNAAKEYEALAKEDPRFIGIDLDTATYWLMGNSFKIKPAGFSLKKEISKHFDKHDDLAKQYGEMDKPEDTIKRVGIMQDLDHAKDEIIERVIPLMLEDNKGGFNTKTWFGDAIPAAVWWDVARDLYLFLRGRGTREDMLRSMIVSK